MPASDDNPWQVKDASIPEGYCPVCTKDLEEDGWCFECRDYTRDEEDDE